MPHGITDRDWAECKRKALMLISRADDFPKVHELLAGLYGRPAANAAIEYVRSPQANVNATAAMATKQRRLYVWSPLNSEPDNVTLVKKLPTYSGGSSNQQTKKRKAKR
jgi:hypothetical protein